MGFFCRTILLCKPENLIYTLQLTGAGTVPGERKLRLRKKKGDHYVTYFVTVKSVTLFDDSNRIARNTLPDNQQQMLQTAHTGGCRYTAGKR